MSPEKIGRYEIKKELGRGGMAVVYLGHDPYMERDVAVKVLPSQFTDDPEFRARFRREAQVIASLDHTAIVPVYDFGEHEEQPFIVMRYMRGGSLADRLGEHGPLSVSEAADVLKRIGSALDEAHQKGIVHRDLKPGNILLDDHGQAFVSDFGIVKVSEATVQYTGNSIIGTPGYMSPEQARGDQKIDGRSDVYSLGAIAFEMLTGKLPYEADTPMGVAMKHILDPVPDVRTVRPDLSLQTSTVISKAMAKEPAQRYDTCSEISAALDEVVAPAADETVLVPPAKDKPGESLETVIDSAEEPSIAKSITPPVEARTGDAKETKRKVPVWAWAVGCLGLLGCAAVAVGLGAIGYFGTIVGNATPTVTVVALISPTPEAITTPTVTPAEPATTIPPTPEAPTTLVRFDSDSSGIGISYPEEWFIREEVDVVMIASAQDLLEDESDINEGAALILFSADQADFGGGSPAEMLTFAFDSFDLAADMTITDGPNPTNVNGQEAAMANISSTSDTGTPLSAIVAVVANLDRAAFVIAATPTDTEDQYRPALEDIIDSIEVGAATVIAQPEVEGIVAVGDNVSGIVTEGSRPRWNLIGIEGEIIDITVEPQSDDFDLVVNVFDESGDSILEGGEVDSSFGTEEILGLALPYSGNYYIVVRGFDNSVGEYRLMVRATGEPGGLFEAGSEIRATDALDSGDDHAFPFSTIAGGGTVTALLESVDELDAVLGVYDDSTGELLDEIDESFNVEELSFVVPSAGDYFFSVTGFDGSVGSYNITLTGPPDVTFELAVGDEVTGRLDDDAQIDYFFRGAAGDEFTFVARPESSLDIVLEIVSPNDSSILAEVDDNFSGEEERLTFTLPDEQVHTVRVRGFAGAVGGYSMAVQ